MNPFDSKIYGKFERNLPCPCDSTLKAKKCCLLNNGLWYKKASNIFPRDAQSNYSNEYCYCSSTNNCSPKISREHYISKSVLLYITNNLKSVTIEGLPWIPNNESKIISVDSLTTKTLCERHNNALSPLDSEACKLFSKIGEYDSSFLVPPTKDEISILSGEDIEMWMLKTACGFVSAKQIGNNNKIKNTQIKQIWIDILAGKAQWPEHWGLYVKVQAGADVIHKAKTFSFVPKINPENDDLLSAEFYINNINFTLLLGTPNIPESFGIYRPRTLIFTDNKIKKFIELSWKDDIYDKNIWLIRTGTEMPNGDNSY